MHVNHSRIQNTSNTIVYTCLFFLGVFITLIRLRLIDIPLERDEGEYGYMAQLMLNGHAPFSLAYNMKYPGTSLIYGIFIAIFGNNVFSVHFGLLLINLVNIVFVFLIGRQLYNQISGLLSATIFGILALSQYYLGFAAHATHFILLFALPGYFYLLKANEKNSNKLYLVSAILLGTSFLMKQSSIFFIFFGFLIISILFIQKKIVLKQVLTYAIGLATPILLLIAWIWITGNFEKFWFWTYTYLIEYGTKLSLSKGLEYFQRELSTQYGQFSILFIAFIIGLISLLLSKSSDGFNKILILLFLLFSFLTVVPGLYFRSHYFITFLPAFSLIIGSAYANTRSFNRFGPIISKLIVALILGGILQTFVNQRGYFFEDSPKKISRNIYGINPFIESIPVANYIKKNSTPTDKIAVLGSEPQIYFYADRTSATGYIYTYNLMEPHEYALTMQQEMIKEIENNNPKFIVYSTIPTSWLYNEKSNRYIFDWIQPYLAEKYINSGVVDFKSNTEINYYWEEDVYNNTQPSRTQLLIYKRRDK
jgi:hypothetical protein